LEGWPAGSAGTPPARQCEACGAFNPVNATHCRECGQALVKAAAPGEPKDREERTSELAEINMKSLPWLATVPFADAVEWAGRDWGRLEQVRKARGYKPGWVYYRMREPQHNDA
jgi:hypothetical protein